MLRYKGILASSADPTGQTLSVTIESFSKVLIGLVGWFAISKGLDPMSATNQVQAIVDLVAQAIPLAFTLYHSLQVGWGLIQKLINYFGVTQQ